MPRPRLLGVYRDRLRGIWAGVVPVRTGRSSDPCRVSHICHDLRPPRPVDSGLVVGSRRWLCGTLGSVRSGITGTGVKRSDRSVHSRGWRGVRRNVTPDSPPSWYRVEKSGETDRQGNVRLVEQRPS